MGITLRTAAACCLLFVVGCAEQSRDAPPAPVSSGQELTAPNPIATARPLVKRRPTVAKARAPRVVRLKRPVHVAKHTKAPQNHGWDNPPKLIHHVVPQRAAADPAGAHTNSGVIPLD